MRNPKGKSTEESEKVKDRIRGGGAAGRARQFNIEHGMDKDEDEQPGGSSSKRSEEEKDEGESHNQAKRSSRV